MEREFFVRDPLRGFPNQLLQALWNFPENPSQLPDHKAFFQGKSSSSKAAKAELEYLRRALEELCLGDRFEVFQELWSWALACNPALAKTLPQGSEEDEERPAKRTRRARDPEPFLGEAALRELGVHLLGPAAQSRAGSRCLGFLLRLPFVRAAVPAYQHSGLGALSFAAKGGRLESIRSLLAAGAQPDPDTLAQAIENGLPASFTELCLSRLEKGQEGFVPEGSIEQRAVNLGKKIEDGRVVNAALRLAMENGNAEAAESAVRFLQSLFHNHFYGFRGEPPRFGDSVLLFSLLLECHPQQGETLFLRGADRCDPKLWPGLLASSPDFLKDAPPRKAFPMTALVMSVRLGELGVFRKLLPACAGLATADQKRQLFHALPGSRNPAFLELAFEVFPGFRPKKGDEHPLLSQAIEAGSLHALRLFQERFNVPKIGRRVLDMMQHLILMKGSENADFESQLRLFSYLAEEAGWNDEMPEEGLTLLASALEAEKNETARALIVLGSDVNASGELEDVERGTVEAWSCMGVASVQGLAYLLENERFSFDGPNGTHLFSMLDQRPDFRQRIRFLTAAGCDLAERNPDGKTLFQSREEKYGQEESEEGLDETDPDHLWIWGNPGSEKDPLASGSTLRKVVTAASRDSDPHGRLGPSILGMLAEHMTRLLLRAEDGLSAQAGFLADLALELAPELRWMLELVRRFPEASRRASELLEGRIKKKSASDRLFQDLLCSPSSVFR